MIKNKIFILLLVLGISCTKNEHPSDEPLQLDSYIFFDEGLVKTKANLHTEAVLPAAANTSYGVMGLRGASNSQVFNMYSNNIAQLYRPAAGENFTYDKLVLWTDEVHRFCAFYPYSASCITGVVADDATTSGVVDPYLSYTQPTTLSDMTDLLTAYTSASYNSNVSQQENLVGINFIHRLFAFNVQIANLYGEKLTITKAKLTVTVPDGAKLYFDGSVKPNTTTKTIVHNYVSNKLELTNGAGINLNNQTNKDKVSFLFLPCQELDIDFELSFINKFGKEVTFNVYGLAPTDAEGFVAGKEYSLILRRVVANDNATFESTIEEWTIGSDINHDFE